MRTLRSTFLLLAGFAAAMTLAQADTAKKKIVFVAGRPSHGPGEHEHNAGSRLLADQLNKSGLPVEATVVSNGWPADTSVFKDASAIIIYSDGGGGHAAIKQLDALKEFAKQGVGLGCIHYAVEVPKGEPGTTFLDVLGGYFETDWSVNPTWTATYKLPKHAVTRGISDFTMYDEWYYHMRFRESMQGITPILSALPTPDSLSRPNGPHEGNAEVRAAVLDRKEPQTMMWVYERPGSVGKGRAFGFTGGHYHKNWQNDDYRRLVLNTIVWTAGLEVPEKGVPSKTPTDEEMTANLDKKR